MIFKNVLLSVSKQGRQANWRLTVSPQMTNDTPTSVISAICVRDSGRFVRGAQHSAGQKDVMKTTIYVHFLDLDGRGVDSPLDRFTAA